MADRRIRASTTPSAWKRETIACFNCRGRRPIVLFSSGHVGNARTRCHVRTCHVSRPVLPFAAGSWFVREYRYLGLKNTNIYCVFDLFLSSDDWIWSCKSKDVVVSTQAKLWTLTGFLEELQFESVAQHPNQWNCRLKTNVFCCYPHLSFH